MKEILIYYDKEIEQTKLDYVLTNINIHPFCKDTIHFSSANKIEIADLLYSKDAINQEHQFKMFALKKLLLKEIDTSAIFELHQVLDGGKMLNFVSVNESKKDTLLIDKIIYADLFETLFFHWSRYEEVVFPKHQRNEWDLMPEEDLFVVKHDLYHQPFLDDLILWFVRLFIPDHQPKHIFEIIPTFDIDYLHFDELSVVENIRIFLSILVKGNRPLKGGLEFFKALFNNKIDLSFLDHFSSNGIIYILCGGKHKFDFPKSKKSYERIVSLINECHLRGIEIGIHPSFETAYSFEKVKTEIELLSEMTKSKLTKSRQHFLHIDYKDTIPLLERLGIEIDSSTGFNLHVGFKVGTSYAFYYWNWEANRISSVLGKPLVWMDSAQWYESKKQINRYKIDTIKYYQEQQLGEICINNHPIFQSKLACYE